MTYLRPRPLALIILDGWGYREDTKDNAIAAAYKPNWDAMWEQYPHILISGSGQCVGLPEGQMGNSEVGHLNMGAGRIVHQDLTRVDLAIETGEFFTNPVLIDALNQAKNNQSAVHILGLLSPGGVHSHEKHIQAMVKLAAQQNVTSVYIHAFLDGRDMPPCSAMHSIEDLDKVCKHEKCGRIVSLIGRYYAMDRDKRWERTHQAYDLLVQGIAEYRANNAKEGLELAYARGETDEFVKATAIYDENSQPVVINDNDVVIFMNFRADRARALTEALVNPDFQGFHRQKWPKLSEMVCLAEYDKKLTIPIAFPPESLHNMLAEYLSVMGFKQLRIAETEKYAHVTFFFNGGIENPYPGEERILIPSPKIPTYDLQPEMSAYELTDRLVDEIKSQQYDVIVCNFANADMVGHTGNFSATVKAIETIDHCLGKIRNALLQVGGEFLITSDHGNAERMFNSITNQAHTAHTSEPVPFVYVGRSAKFVDYAQARLSDVAPTMLYLLGLPQPKEMTGKNLIKLV